MLLEEILEEGQDFKTLKKNKVELTPEERSEVLAKDGVWGNDEVAVWKSKKKDGSFVYVTNSHRAFNTAPSLKGAIGKFHSFIKSTG